MQFLYDYHSAGKCLSATKRHSRLCRQIPGGTKYEQQIAPFQSELQTREAELETAEDNAFTAKDVVRLSDSLLAALLIKVHHRCSEYDNQNTGSFTVKTLFPNGKYSEITQFNMYKEPDKALELAEKLTALGTTHALYPLALELKEAVQKSKKAIADEETAITALGLSKSNAEISKLRLIRRYNSNYFQAGDEGGKAFAERLFPDLGGNDKKNNDSDKKPEDK